MAKRTQQESGQERVTAKSRPMMNLTARMPSVVSSSTPSNPGRNSYGYQDPGKSVVVDDRSGQPDRLSPTGCSKSDCDRLGLLKSGKVRLRRNRSGKLDETSWNAVQQICPHHGDALLDGNAHSVTYGEIIHDGSGKLRKSILKKGQIPKLSSCGKWRRRISEQSNRSRQKKMSNVAQWGEEHSTIWGMFMAATMNVATFMGKNFSTIQNFIMNSEDLTFETNVRFAAKLVNDQDEINGLDKIHWEKNSWRQLSLIGDEIVLNLLRTKV